VRGLAEITDGNQAPRVPWRKRRIILIESGRVALWNNAVNPPAG